MLNKELFLFLVNAGGTPPQPLTISIDNDGMFGEIDYTTYGFTIVHIKNETPYKITINDLKLEGSEYEHFTVGILSSSILQSGEEAIVNLFFDPTISQNRFSKNYYSKIQIIQSNRIITTAPLMGIGVVMSLDCGTDLTNDQKIDCGRDILSDDFFNAGNNI